MQPVCYIIGAGTVGHPTIRPTKQDCVIAADAGYLAAKRLGLVVDCVVGDFDSMQKPQGENVIALNPVKNVTDMHAAVEEGRKRGYQQFYLFGGLGGARLSHTLANIQLLAELAQAGDIAYLFGAHETLTAITDTSYTFSAEMQGFLSVFSHSDVSYGVSETGLRYTLDRVELSNAFPLGVSNEFTGQRAVVSVEHGTLILLWGEQTLG